MRKISSELQAAVESTYRVFPGYRLHRPIGVCNCNCCVSDEDEQAMVSTPRRELPLRLIKEFNSSAHGRNDDLLRYFLPRMFELVAQGENICSMDETLGFEGLGEGSGPLCQLPSELVKSGNQSH